MSDALLHLLLFATGIVTGTLNVLAGGGSFLSLPVLIFAGLPPTVANGTNRLGILTQNVAAVWSFQRARLIDWRLGWTASIPAVVGAGLGTWGALEVGDETFRRVLAFLMVAVTLWTLVDPMGRAGRRRRRDEGREGREKPAPQEGGKGEGAQEGSPPAEPPRLSRRRLALLAVLFFGVGLYGGFVQAGVGFFILAATTVAGLDLVRGNAVKVLLVLAFTPLTLALFAWQGKVEWLPALALGAGTLVGGYLGARLTALKGHRWVQGVVTVAVVVFAVLLWLRG